MAAEDLLRCVRCSGRLASSDKPWEVGGAAEEWPALACVDCGSRYPVYEDVPVLFADDERIGAVLDARFSANSLREVGDKMARATALASDALEELKEGDALLDSLGWEIYFWEEWKKEDLGVVHFDRSRIDAFLATDVEGGGRIAFLERVSEYAGGLSGRTVLNIGAGRDLLLERFLDAGCGVVEVDVVLEPLVYLRGRGATLCVCCDARKLPFADASFDAATSFGTLHHIWPIGEPIAEMMRVTEGNVHVNEPNSLALTRVALRLPAGIRNRLKRWYSEGGSRSPYESCISPRALTRAVKEARGDVIDMSFPRSSWMTQESQGLRRAVRALNLMLVRLMPFTSSHFDAVFRGAEIGRGCRGS